MLLADAGMTAAALLAAVLAWAGAAKLQRGPATVDGFTALGMPQPRYLARGVPVVELVIAVLLIAVPLIGGALALVLLASFTALLVVRIRAGSEVPCACFGQPNAPPLSWTEVVRNGILAVLALLALFTGRAHVPGLRGVLVSVGLGVIALGVLSQLHASASAGGGRPSS
jgi:uncharacterized membrane protein YphA (DoxX/SURF4 family)